MTADSIIKEVDRAIDVARARLKSESGLLSHMDRAIWPKMKALIKWEKLDAADEARVVASYNDRRSAIFSAIEEARIAREAAYGGRR